MVKVGEGKLKTVCAALREKEAECKMVDKISTLTSRELMKVQKIFEINLMVLNFSVFMSL